MRPQHLTPPVTSSAQLCPIATAMAVALAPRLTVLALATLLGVSSM